MLKQPITFTDFNGVQRQEDIYFNLTEEELVTWQADSEDGLQKEMQDAIATKDMKKLLNFIKTLVSKAYGERDKDGIHFNKSPELSRRFENSAMYSPLMMSLFADEGETTANFINGLMPADLVKRAMEQGNIPNPDAFAAENGYAPDARQEFQNRLAKLQEEAGQGPQHNVAAPIGTRRENREAQQFEEQTGFTPSLPSEPVVQSSHNPQDAAPLQVDHVSVTPEPKQEEHKPFRVIEEPMDPMGNVQSTNPADDEGYQEFLRRKAAGEL